LLGALVASPFTVFELLRVSLEVVDGNERVVEEARGSNDEVQRVVDNDEKGAVVMSGEPNVDCGAAISEVGIE
jgi:hypothetical protein